MIRSLGLAGFLWLGLSMVLVQAGGVDTSGGRLTVTKAGQPIATAEAAVDLSDLTDGSVRYAMSYDHRGLKVSLQVKEQNPLRNQNDPIDRSGWKGSCVQLRFDTAGDGKKLYDFTFWFNHLHQKAYWSLSCNAPQLGPGWTAENAKQLDKIPGIGAVFNKNRDNSGYTCEIQLPWQVFGLSAAPAENSEWSALLEVLLGNAEGTETRGRCVSLYSRHTGVFGFQRYEQWGKIKFGGTPVAQKSLLALQQEEKLRKAAALIPIKVELTQTGMITVNIMDSEGKIIRELVSEKVYPVGTMTVAWDGRDWRGRTVSPGTYGWTAEIHSPVKAKYLGSVGSSGQPPHETIDGTGGWGSDHNNPLDVATDSSGARYFLWRGCSEMGSSLVKIDAGGKTLWRVKPPNHTGFGDFWSVAVDDRYAYVLIGERQVELCRVTLANGRTAPFDNGGLFIMAATKQTEKPLYKTDPPYASGTGLAVRDGFAYVSLYHENTIAIIDIKKCAVVNRIALPKPCGLCFDSQGNLYAISQDKNSPKVVVFKNATEPAQPVITAGLKEPWDLAILKGGKTIAITDMAPSVNQILVFFMQGKLYKQVGAKGGRTGVGKYQPDNLLRPAGIAATGSGGFIVCEDSIPKAITEFNQDGRTVKKWYGPTAYGGFAVPDPNDPSLIYNLGNFGTPGFLIRSRLNFQTGRWSGPLACWDFSRDSRLKQLPDFFGASGVPQIVKFNGNQYMCSGFAPQSLLRIDGETITPAATLTANADGRPKIDYHQGKPSAKRDNVFPLPIDSGYLLEAESMDMKTAPPLSGLPRLFRKPGGSWTEIVFENNGGANLQGNYPLANHLLQWSLPSAPPVGRYEVYVNITHAGDNIFYNSGLSVGSAPGNLRSELKPSFRPSGANSYHLSWQRLGEIKLNADDRVIQWDFPQINSQQFIVNAMVLRYVEKLPPAPGSMSLFGYGVDSDLNLYYQGGRGIYMTARTGINKQGNPVWDSAKYRMLIKDYCPGIPDADLVDAWRQQVRGIMLDRAKNIYVLWNAGPESSGPHWAANLTYSRLSKYNPDGKLLWEVGMKAMGPRRDGEIYNSHVIAGIIDDRYIVIADETGLMHFYTLDGIYRGHIFNDLGRPVAPGPYTFTGETFAGRVQFDAASGKTFAYSGNTDARVFDVTGLGNEKVISGKLTVTERQTAALEKNAMGGKTEQQGKIAILPSNATTDFDTAKWINATPFIFIEGDEQVGKLFVGTTGSSLLLRFEVKDTNPWRNSADTMFQSFISGDGVDLYLGPAGTRQKPILGDVRILMVPDGVGGVNVIGMKPLTQRENKPQRFATLVLSADFAWMGKIPGAAAKVKVTDNGYTLEASIPGDFFENLSLRDGSKVRFDADILFSDDSGRETMRRVFLFSRGAQVSMVNDVPTEASLYPEKWNNVFIGGKPSTRKVHLDPLNKFDELQATFLEAENAAAIPTGFAPLARFQGNIDKIYNSGTMPATFKTVWNLDQTTRGKNKLFVSWAKGGVHPQAEVSVKVGSDAGKLRDCGHFPTDNPASYGFAWHQAPFSVDIGPDDRILELTITTAAFPNAQFFLDAVALLPEQ